MEKVQKRMTIKNGMLRLIFKNMPYPERLKILGLKTLESRRLVD